ncbi:MAG: HD domain-containing protein [Myxococcales bacterium]|nr:HD domain-containing protein [Myxococcales bacterium]
MNTDLRAIAAQIPEPIHAVCRALRAAGFEAHLVGGAIRDLFIGRAAHDFDIATSAHPHQVTQVFGRRRTIPTGEKHGTVTVLVDAGGERIGVEVTTFRGEGAYSDGRRPDSVAFVSDLVEDLRRRDFTVNAIAFDPAEDRSGGVVSDPFGGLADLVARRLRAVGEAGDRFAEDGLRVMRAVRLAAQLDFHLDAATEAAIPGAIPVFRKVSMERVRGEILKLLAAPRPSVGLRLMQSSGLLAEVIPELTEGIGLRQNRFHAHDVFEHTLATVDETSGGPIVRLGALLHDVAKPRTVAPKEDAPGENSFFRHEQVGAEMAEAIGRRLKLANRDRERVVALVAHHMFWYSPEWTDATVRRFINRVGLELIPDLFAVRAGDVRGRGFGEEAGREIDELQRRIDAEVLKASALKITDLAVRGADVMRVLACRPGPVIGEVLRRLLERVIEEPSLNATESLEALIPVVAEEAALAPAR